MATISFDLVSPENLIFNDEVGMIIVPGKDGDFGVLPGHSKVMSSLRPGRVMVYGEDKNLLKVRTKNISQYRTILAEKISSLPNVSSTSTFVSMETIKD